MHKLFTSLAFAILALESFAASPAATQSWVIDYMSRYVSTNTSAKTATVSSSMEIDGTNVTFSMTLNFASEPSWQICESTVTGMPVGTQFALDSYGNACNYTNTACPVIYMSMSTNWTFVTGGVTNTRSVVQLDFDVDGVPYRGWEDYRYEEATAAGVSNETGYVKFRRSYVLPSEKALLTTPPASVSLLDILFGKAYAAWVPEEWKLDETLTEDMGTYYVYHWKSHYYWDGEALSVEIPSLRGSFENGAEIYYDIGYKTDLATSDKTYCQRDTIDVHSLASEVLDGVLAAAKSKLGEKSLAYIGFKAFHDKGSFDEQISSAILNAITPYNVSLTCPQEKTTNEEKKTEPEEPTAPDTPPKPPSGCCRHTSVYCSSTESVCSFRCSACKTLLQTGSHDYNDSPRHCAKCSNSYKGEGKVVCGRTSGERARHFFSTEYGGTEEGCRCRRGSIWSGHPETSLSNLHDGKWVFNGTSHWKEFKCGVCGYQPVKKDSEEHEKWMQYGKGPFYYPDRCETSNICYRCGYSVLDEVVGHTGEMSHEKISETRHKNYFYCDECHRRIERGDEPHVSDGEYRGCKYKDDENHEVRLLCMSGTNGCSSIYLSGTERHVRDGKYIRHINCPTNETLHYVEYRCKAGTNGCDHTFLDHLEAHRVKEASFWSHLSNNLHRCYGVCTNGCGAMTVYIGVQNCQKAKAPLATLVANPKGRDYYPCCLCGEGVAEYRSHCWHKDGDHHWCQQPDDSRKHLYGAHTFVSNVCTVCNFPRDPYEYWTTYVTAYCKGADGSTTDGCCNGGQICYRRLCISNDVEIAESERGPWEKFGGGEDSASCHFLVEGECKCPYCSGETENLLYDDCYCKHMSGVICLTTSHVVKSYFREWAGDDSSLINFNDPVLDIDPNCFEEAFVSMPHLLTAKMETVTNVGDYAFRRAFTNDTLLSMVRFDGLETAGYRAFSEAFVGCPLNLGCNFDSLKECEPNCFAGAFAKTKVGSLSFGSLVNPRGDLDFFGGEPCNTLSSLACPKLDIDTYDLSDEVFSFNDMTNLVSIDFSAVSTNTFNVIGDLSRLSKLTRLDLHKMEGVPSYLQTGDVYGRHAPTNNLGCMIVVPDDLWPEWVAAPGWHDIRGQIVPYSNQVMRAVVTVSFDTDMGTTLQPTNLYSGDLVYAPTEVYRFGEEWHGYSGYSDGSFSLEGWYLDAAKTLPFASGSVVTSNMTLYAKWTDNRYVTIGSGAVSAGSPGEFDLYNVTTRTGTDSNYAKAYGCKVVTWDATHVSTNDVTDVGWHCDSSFDVSAGCKAKLLITCADGRVLESNEVTLTE